MNKLILLLSFLLLSCKSQQIAEPVPVYTCIQYTTISDNSDSMVFGNPENLQPAELIYEWRLKERKTPERLMLAKANLESGNHVNIFRLEKRLNMISCGLFQVLKNDAIRMDIQQQMSEYDSLMNWCMVKSGGNIPKAVFYYNTPFGFFSGNEWWVAKTMRNYSN